MNKRRDHKSLLHRKRDWRVHAAGLKFITYWTFSIAAIPLLLIIEYHHWNGNCHAWPWNQKINHQSVSCFNQHGNCLTNLNFRNAYNVKANAHRESVIFIETVNISSNTSGTLAAKRQLSDEFDTILFFDMPPSTLSIKESRCTLKDSNDSASWYRAYVHIQELIDLSRSSSINGIVHMAFEEFVRQLLLNYKHQSLVTNHTLFHDEQYSLRLMEAIEDLLYKIYSTASTSPSLSTIERIWSIYQYDLKDLGQRNALPSIRLLHRWMNWSKHHGTLLYESPPPVHLIVQFISSMNFNESGIFSDLWSLYKSTIVNYPFPNEEVSQRHPRIQIDRTMLQIVSESGLEWDHYQCSILQSAIRKFCKSTHPEEVVHLYGGEHILWRALCASSKVGHVDNTVWLSRLIRAFTIPIDQQANLLREIALRVHLFESLLHSSDPGSLRRMERYLKENIIPFNSTTFKMLLKKFSKTKSTSHQQQVSIGRRAERFFYQVVDKMNGTGWYPDVECAHCVIEAYLPPLVVTRDQPSSAITNSTQYLLQLRMVDQFIRQFMRQFGLQNQHVPDESTNETQPSSYQIFARLLNAYIDVALLALSDNNTTRNAIQVAVQADTVFRYFMIQHRDGNIDATIERPNDQHLKQLGWVFHICTKAAIESDNTSARSSTIMNHMLQSINEYQYLLQTGIR